MSMAACECLDPKRFAFELKVPESCWDLWSDSLPSEWAKRYPALFTKDDLRLALKQPTHHFREWVVAVHFHRVHNLRVLSEKWRLHPWKADIARFVLGKAHFAEIKDRGSGVPDLLVYDPAHPSSCFFVEVKGRSPKGRPESETGQKETARVVRGLGYDVLVFRVHKDTETRGRCLGTSPRRVDTPSLVAGRGESPRRRRSGPRSRDLQ